MNLNIEKKRIFAQEKPTKTSCNKRYANRWNLEFLTI